MLDVIDLCRPGTPPVNFHLDAGECLAVQGPSGAGKSVLLRAIADLDPALGRVTLNGQDRNSFTGPQWRQHVGYVPAEPGWWADTIGAHFKVTDTVRDLMGRLALDQSLLNKPVIQASTGERTRLALVRALCIAPQVLLLDEPTSALDHTNTLAVEALIADFQRKGLAVVWVTHDPAQADRISNRCLKIGPL